MELKEIHVIAMIVFSIVGSLAGCAVVYAIYMRRVMNARTKHIEEYCKKRSS